MKQGIYSALLGILVFAFNVAEAKNGPATQKSGKQGNPGVAAGCAPPTESTELDINNTRALIHTGGDMWWDLVGQARYEIPIGSGRNALFAGSLWLGGQDISGQLKVAAQRFRSNGNDFWTGPLGTEGANLAEIDASTCDAYDVHFVSTRDEVAEFVGWYECQLDPDCDEGENYPQYQVPEFIQNWPAHGRNYAPYYEDFYLAPFVDRDNDGIYNFENGDYPGYDLAGATDCRARIVNIYGDKNLWWIFNDKGNIHTETGSDAIGMEIRAQAFGFATNDEVNNMTFYNYELVNRSTFTLTNTYFGQWVDADLGNARDDYVGCDVQRGLGYAYNGDEFDEDAGGAIGYGDNPPAIGVDFFQGPFQDNDGKDNCLCNNFQSAILDDGIVYDGSGVGYGDGFVDNERLGMRAFLYHNNANTVIGDPTTGPQYYNYLRSIWRDNSNMVYGGTGHPNSVPPPHVEADFMFPGDSDPLGWGTGGVPQPEWTEVTSNNVPEDRRFMQSAGPFTLGPGAVNNITVGVVWARATSGGAEASVAAVRKADDKTQALFDACFVLIDGPDAPELSITELDQELIITYSNPLTSNNYEEGYAQEDPFIIAPDTLIDPATGDPVSQESDPLLYAELESAYKTYKFQGYLIYQVYDESVSPSELDNPDKARLIFQCDLRDDVADLTNYTYDRDLDAIVPEAMVVNAANEGISKSFSVGLDQFASGEATLVNFKTYYFMAIAYAYNNYKTYDQQDPEALDGQKLPYLPSRKGPTGAIRVVSAIPHKPTPTEGGTTLNASYGDEVEITKLEGIGNSTREIELTEESVNEIMAGAPWKAEFPVYEKGKSPIKVQIVDPLNVQPGNYTIAFNDPNNDGDLSDANYGLFGGDLEDTIWSYVTISDNGETLIPSLGISITANDADDPGSANANNNGIISASIEYDNSDRQWLSGVSNTDGNNYQNWIRSGTNCEADNPEYCDYEYTFNTNKDGIGLDDEEYFENILGGTWTAYRMAAWNTHSPIYNETSSSLSNGMFQGLPIKTNNPAYQLNYLNSVDIVFTDNKDLWTRVPVVEMQDDPDLSEYDASVFTEGATKSYLRKAPSVDKDGNPADPTAAPSDNPADANYISATGMGWFPGYAIDIETGERLNMAFGEDSYLQADNGNDMLWNPTETVYAGGLSPISSLRFGGKHYVFVFRNNIVEEQVHQVPQETNSSEYRVPAYDAGKSVHDLLAQETTTASRMAWRACSWVGLPVLAPLHELLETDATIKLRVNKSYQLWSNGIVTKSIGETLEAGKEYLVKQGPVNFNGTEYVRNEVITVTNSGVLNSTSTTGADITDNVVEVANGGRPMYQFKLDEFVPTTNEVEVAEDALDLIDIVPNPYYAYSQYEIDKLDTRVKLINLPQACHIRIFTLDGILVREYTKDDPSVTFIEWDLKNGARIPIASGIYLIHVDVPGVGEKVIKWFGVLRPVDLDSF